jgi:hypothetical protein
MPLPLRTETDQLFRHKNSKAGYTALARSRDLLTGGALAISFGLAFSPYGDFFAYWGAEKKKEMRDMKKLVTLGLAAVLGTALVTGCQKKEETTSTTTSTEQQPAVVQETGTTATSTMTTTDTGAGMAMTGTETTSTGTMGTMAPSTTTTSTVTSTETKKKM